MNKKLSVIILLSLLIVFFTTPLFAQEAKQELPHKMFRFNNASCEEMEAVIRLYLSPDGKIAVVKRLNAILVKDHAENLKKIEAVLKKSDVPSPMVKVNVQFLGRSHYKNNAIYAGAVQRGNHWRIGVRPDFSNTKQTNSTSMSLMIMSGSSGFIKIGENVPYRSWFLQYCRRYGYIVGEQVQFVSVSTGFYVTPQVRGNNIFVSISPGIAYFDGKKNGRIKFREAQSEVMVKNNQTVVLGVGNTSSEGSGIHAGASGNVEVTKKQTKALMHYILGGGSYSSDEVFTMLLTVKKVRQ